MAVPAPPIDRRSFSDVVAQTERLLQRYSSWRAVAAGDENGWALVRIFARLAELVIDRLNQVPDKNFLAFLNLVGVELLPPRPARVPLTFHLAAGSPTDALVPARTPVAAIPAEGDAGPVIFETERELVVTRSELAAVFTREPGRDRYSDNTAVATGQAIGAFPAFQGDRPIEHRLYLGGSGLFSLEVGKTITLRVAPAEAEAPWIRAVDWAFWDGTTWQPHQPAGPPIIVEGGWQVVLPGVPSIPPTMVGGRTSAWLRGRLRTSLPRGDLIPLDPAAARINLRREDLPSEAGFADVAPLDFIPPWYPFGERTPRSTFYLASSETFSKPGAQVKIGIDLDSAQPVQPSPDLGLEWEFWDGTAWRQLGRSSPTSSSTAPSPHGFSDETQAFTRDGVIGFRCPDTWASGDVGGVTGFWLRARVATGDYGPPTDYRPPAVQRLALSYTWPLPRIDRVQVRVRIQRAGLLPDLAFTNQLPLDPTKDFFPFGEKPKFNDTLYLASAESLSKPDANITLTVTLTNPSDETGTPPPAQPSDKLMLSWEFWNGDQRKWDFLGESGPGARRPPQHNFQDGTSAFVVDGKVTFTCPIAMGAVEVNGQLRQWIRVRIAAGDYGVEARYDPLIDPQTGGVVTDRTTGLPVYQLVPASFKPPSIKSILFSYDYTSPLASPDNTLIENDFAFVDRSLEAGTGGQVFNPFTPSTDTRPTLYLGFQRPGADTGFANRTTALYSSVAEALYGESPAEGPADGEPAAVAWEYWNGSAWARLGSLDETQGFIRRGLVTFIGPPDFRASAEFGHIAFWLRARWDRGGYALPPQLRRVLTNTMWAAHTLTVQNEILGSSNGEPDQLFRTTKAPVLPGQRVEVREPEAPSAAERAAIEAEEGTDAIRTVSDPSGRVVESWVGWHQVPDFHESGPRSRHYTLDRLTGEIRFGNGQRGLVPPQGRANVRAAWYQTGGGPQGNRPAGSINQLKRAVPYVDRVANTEASSGGSAQETLEAVRNRGPRTLRHRNRAVAIADYEDLAFEASPAVARVKGIPAQASESAGSVGLLIVPRDTDPRPIPSLELLGRVKDFIAARLPPTADLWVAGPDWLRVTVTAEVVPVFLEIATDVQAAVLARLAAFLHPLTGALDGKGWAFGRKPYRSDLYALIEGTPGVDHVRHLTVDEMAENGMVRPTRFLVYSGAHLIMMVGGSAV